ncbi:hypothetical protein LNP25_07225 [Klebsiella variicola subsp. variicola]|nr:hypothetical protein [Klebsiella variicola subsp. variicola]
MQTRSCDLPLDKYVTEQGEASKVLPLAKSIVFKTAPVRSVSPINERFPATSALIRSTMASGREFAGDAVSGDT